MKLVHVIPIVKGITKDRLSYFSNQDIRAGSLVSVPVRNRTVTGLVTGLENIEDAKERLKHSSYMIKKVGPSENKTVLIPEFIYAAHKAAAFFAARVGAVLHQLIPKIIFEHIEQIPESPYRDTKPDKTVRPEQYILQADEQARHMEYKDIVRESFSNTSSVFILTPTIKEAESLREKLAHGIEKFTFTLHSEVPKKELLRRIVSIAESTHPVLIVGTGAFLSAPRQDIATIIVERETARSFKMQSRPYIDFRIFARLYAKALGARFVLADMPLSVQTIFEYRQKEYRELIPSYTRTQLRPDQYVVDMRPKEEQAFTTISTELQHALKENQQAGKQLFIFNVRRGLAPTTICEDCGNVVLCHLCRAPMVLHVVQHERVFVCHACGANRTAKERCKTCGSWKLKMLGIGTSRIKEELTECVTSKKLFSIDSDTTKTYSQAVKTAEAFYKTPGGVLVGTELALSFLRRPVSVSAIASIDSLLALPDPKMYEHIFSLILQIRAIAEEQFYLQTRQPDLPLITQAVEGNIRGFYETEILNRRRFDYPPFTILIKVTATGTEQQVIKTMKQAEHALHNYPFSIYPAFTKAAKERYMLHGLLKISRDKWPDEKLLERLRSLPPDISVNVSPESTL